MRALTEGTCLSSRYTLMRRIAGGGMADVWLAQDARNDHPLALKILHEKFAADTGYPDAFRREWQIASRLMHAHIVRVFDYHDDEERPYFALQYLDGQSISALHGRPLEHILGPAGLIADALRYAHGKDIVHSDITGANIVLDGKGAPYLLDFGAARTDGTKFSNGGTPAALSPQQRAGEPAHPADD
ncbi:MAG: serine/threonine-protein kinase, partial [Woeseia sp.]